MKLRYLVLFLITGSLYAAIQNDDMSRKDDPMINALNKVDPDKLQEILIPGYFPEKATMKRYLAAAQKATNITYKRIHSYRAWDLIRGTKALGQLGIGGLGIAAAYGYYKGFWDISHWKLESDKSRKIGGIDIVDEKYRMGVYGALGFLSWYFINDGLTELSEIFNKKEQWRRHREALANEAVILRIPVCEADSCEAPKN